MTTLTLTLVESPNSVSALIRAWLWTPSPGSWSLVLETVLSVGVPVAFTVPGTPAVVLPDPDIGDDVFAIPAGTAGGSQVLPGVSCPGTIGRRYDPRQQDSPVFTQPDRGPSPPVPTPSSVFIILLDRKSGFYVFTCA